MSMEALRWAQSLTEEGVPGLKGPRKWVLLTITSHENKDGGKCRLKWSTIASESGIGISTAEQAGKWLRKNGVLSWDVWRRDDGRFGALDFIIHRQPPVGATDGETAQPPVGTTPTVRGNQGATPWEPRSKNPLREPTTEPTPSTASGSSNGTVCLNTSNTSNVPVPSELDESDENNSFLTALAGEFPGLDGATVDRAGWGRGEDEVQRQRAYYFAQRLVAQNGKGWLRAKQLAERTSAEKLPPLPPSLSLKHKVVPLRPEPGAPLAGAVA